MLELDFDAITRFAGQVAKEQIRLNTVVNEVFRRWVHRIYTDIVTVTPQWSGNTAANWHLGVNGMPESQEFTIPEKAVMWPPGDLQPFDRLRPNYEAMQESFERLHSQFGYGDQVFIYNTADVYPQIEARTIYIRPVNLLPSAEMPIIYAFNKYSMTGSGYVL